MHARLINIVKNYSISSMLALLMFQQSCSAGSLRVMLTTTKTDPECQRVLAGFHAAYPEITVVPVYSDMANPSTDPKRRPDVFLGWQDYVGDHIELFEDLGAIVPPEIIRDFPKTFKDACSVGKTLFCLPCGGSADALAYNIGSFRDVGLAVPDDSWTWSGAFRQACRKLTADKNGDGTPEKWGTPASRGLMDAIVYCHGGRFVDRTGKMATFQDKGTMDGLNYFMELLRSKVVEPIDAKMRFRNLIEWPFYNGKSAMMLFLQGTLDPARTQRYLQSENVRIRLRLARLPSGPAGPIAPVSLYYVVAMTKKAENKAEALKFVKYMAGIDGQNALRTMTGFLPTTYSGLRSREITTSVPRPFLESYTKGIPDSLLTEPFDARQALWQHINDAVKSGDTLAVAVADAAEEARKILNKSH